MNKFLKSFVAVSFVYLLLIVFGKEDIAWYLKPLLLPCLILATNETNNFPTKNGFFLL